MSGVAHLVGCGPGGIGWVTPAARSVVASCDVVFGPDDLQTLFPEAIGARSGLPSRPEAAAPLVGAALERGLSCAVLVRGDCGVRSLARGLQALLPDGSCRRVPGLSSVQVACAAFGLDWDGARILSAHGRRLEPLEASDRAAPALVLLGGGEGFAEIVEQVRDAYGPCGIHLASDLTLPTERLVSIPQASPVPRPLPSRTVAIFEKESP